MLIGFTGSKLWSRNRIPRRGSISHICIILIPRSHTCLKISEISDVANFPYLAVSRRVWIMESQNGRNEQGVLLERQWRRLFLPAYTSPEKKKTKISSWMVDTIYTPPHSKYIQYQLIYPSYPLQSNRQSPRCQCSARVYANGESGLPRSLRF